MKELECLVLNNNLGKDEEAHVGGTPPLNYYADKSYYIVRVTEMWHIEE